MDFGSGQFEFLIPGVTIRKIQGDHDRVLACLVTQVSTAVELEATDQET
jgi:hypothetical protein